MSTIKIGLLGFGVVGQGVWQLLEKNRRDVKVNTGVDIEVARILVKNTAKPRILPAENPLFTSQWQDIIKSRDIQVVVELMGGIHPAYEYIKEALLAGKNVVTANKALLAQHGTELTKLAQENQVQLRYEASVAGGIPVLQAIEESLSANRLDSMIGIVNGTTNYILTKMTQEGVTFDQALLEAQEQGYAEADPSADVEGFDAAHKLTLLASLGFKTEVSFHHVYREGIDQITPLDIEYARELGYVIKLLAIARNLNGRIELRVHPTMIPGSHPLAAVNEAFNAVYVRGNAVGELMFYGKGAGALPTASAVVGDVINVVRLQHVDTPMTYPLHYHQVAKEVQNMDETTTAFFVRLVVKDIPGVLGEIATAFGKRGVSLSSVIQKGETDPVSLVFVTHATRELALRQAVKDIQYMDELVDVASIIRVEEL